MNCILYELHSRIQSSPTVVPRESPHKVYPTAVRRCLGPIGVKKETLLLLLLRLRSCIRTRLRLHYLNSTVGLKNFFLLEMGSRGRGGFGRGGGGRGGGGFGFVKQEPIVLFPSEVSLPNVKEVAEEKDLVKWNYGFQNYWKSSPYYLEASSLANSEDTEIERYSTRGKPKIQGKHDPLSYHLKLTPAYFVRELIQGSRRVQHDQRKVRWNPESGLHRLDVLEKLEEKDGNEKEKEEEEEEEEDEEDGGEYSDDGDYNQNRDFDDDEDDFNMADDIDDEPLL